MNRRSFLLKLGAAAASAAAVAALDPERLLWVPGAKTIVDLGATKPILPATDAEIVRAATTELESHLTDAQRYALFTSNPTGDRHDWLKRQYLHEGRKIRLDLPNERGGLTSFHFERDTPDGDDRLVSVHSEAELRLLNRHAFGVSGRAAVVINVDNKE